jgi:hypothetical protein
LPPNLKTMRSVNLALSITSSIDFGDALYAKQQ